MKTHPNRALYSILKYWRSAGLKNLPIYEIEEEDSIDPELKRKELESLNEEFKNCQNCSLSGQRLNVVFGSGNPNADLFFIGSAPYKEDDKLGLPFQGETGELLDRMFQKMGFKREELYLSTLVKCRPENDRNPNNDEISSCLSILTKQIQLVQPKIICTLGSLASSHLLNSKDPIARIRGKIKFWNKIPVMPTFHPAYLLKKKAARKDVWQDMLIVLEQLNQKGN